MLKRSSQSWSWSYGIQLWCENKELKKQQVVHFEMQCDDDNIDQHKSHKIRTLQTKKIKKNNANEEKKQTQNYVVAAMMMMRKGWHCDDNHIAHETKTLQMK